MKDYTDFDVLRQMETFERIANPPWLRRMRRIEEIVTSPVIRQMKAVQDMTRPMRAIEEVVTSPVIRQMKAAQEAFQDMVNPPWLRKEKELQDMLHPPAIRHLKGIHENLRAGAALHAKSFFPHIDSDNITSALSAVASSPLGRTIDMVARTFPSRSMLASEALSALTGLKLRGEMASMQLDRDAPFVSSLADLQNALETSEDGDALVERLVKAVEAIVRRLIATLQASKSKSDDRSLVNFIILVATVLTLHYVRVQIHYADLAEKRAERQESEVAIDRLVSDENTKKLQEALDKLIELQKAALRTAQHADTNTMRFCVDAAVIVREYQDNRSSRLAFLPRGAVVTVTEVTRDWIRVELTDHVAGIVRHGWARKKYLSRCKN